MKYWVSDLSNKAYDVLVSTVRNNLINDYSIEEANEYINDLKNEKLGNLSFHLSYDDMIKLSNM